MSSHGYFYYAMVLLKRANGYAKSDDYEVLVLKQLSDALQDKAFRNFELVSLAYSRFVQRHADYLQRTTAWNRSAQAITRSQNRFHAQQNN